MGVLYNYIGMERVKDFKLAMVDNGLMFYNICILVCNVCVAFLE